MSTMVELTEAEETEKPTFSKWIPKKWKPTYTRCVALHAAGLSNTEIAKDLNYTPQQVCNIINTPQAKLIMKQIHDKILASVDSTIDSNLQQAAVKAAERIRDYMNSDERFANAGSTMVEKGFKVLEAIGKTKKSEPASAGKSSLGNLVNNGSMFIMSSEAVKELSDSIRLAESVDKLHGSPLAQLLPGVEVSEKNDKTSP